MPKYEKTFKAKLKSGDILPTKYFRKHDLDGVIMVSHVDNVGSRREWYVSEYSTGMILIGMPRNTEAIAIKEAIGMIKRKGLEAVKDLIKNNKKINPSKAVLNAIDP